METDIIELSQKISEVEQQIEIVEEHLAKAEEKDDVAYWRKEKEQLRKEEEQLREERLVLLKDGNRSTREAEPVVSSDALAAGLSNMNPFIYAVDHSEKLLHGLLPPLDELPQYPLGLSRVLFPWNHGEQHVQLPVAHATYCRMKIVKPVFADQFLRVSSLSSKLCAILSSILDSDTAGLPTSEADVSFEVQCYIRLFTSCNNYCLDGGAPLQLSFNKSEAQSFSTSGATQARLRPDTVGVMSRCTFLVGEERLSSTVDAVQDIMRQMKSLNPRFYGDLRFILGYVAGGTLFQWMFIGKDGALVHIDPVLDLVRSSDRVYLMLSVFNAFTLIRKMSEKVPHIPACYPLFSSKEQGNTTIFFMSDSVHKTVKDFIKYCERTGTDFQVVKRAYDAVKGSNHLPKVIGEPTLRGGIYKVELGPLGYSPLIGSEKETKLLARCVCNALKVLHEKGFVHRDVRLPNIVEVTPGQYILIDLETVAEAPFYVHPSFQHLLDWSWDMLEDSFYTPKSDLYQLGRILGDEFRLFTGSPSAQNFISRLMSKQVDANLALEDPWLKVDEEMSGRVESSEENALMRPPVSSSSKRRKSSRKRKI